MAEQQLPKVRYRVLSEGPGRPVSSGKVQVDGLNGEEQGLEDVNSCSSLFDQQLMYHQRDLLDERLKQEQVELVEPEPPPESEEVNQMAIGRKTKVIPLHHSNVISACKYNLHTRKSEDIAQLIINLPKNLLKLVQESQQ